MLRPLCDDNENLARYRPRVYQADRLGPSHSTRSGAIVLPMRSSRQNPSLQDRLGHAAQSKSALLKKFKQTLEPKNNPALLEKRQQREATAAARVERAAQRAAKRQEHERELARQAASAAQAAARATADAERAALEQAARAAAEQAEREVAQKAERDARYLARKAAKKLRRKGP